MVEIQACSIGPSVRPLVLRNTFRARRLRTLERRLIRSRNAPGRRVCVGRHERKRERPAMVAGRLSGRAFSVRSVLAQEVFRVGCAVAFAVALNRVQLRLGGSLAIVQ